MTNGKVKLSGYLDMDEARRDEVLAALPEHIRLSRAEPGCLAFDVRPDPERPNRLLVEELFADRAAFEAHQARSRESAWGRLTHGLARSYRITEG